MDRLQKLARLELAKRAIARELAAEELERVAGGVKYLKNGEWKAGLAMELDVDYRKLRAALRNVSDSTLDLTRCNAFIVYAGGVPHMLEPGECWGDNIMIGEELLRRERQVSLSRTQTE